MDNFYVYIHRKLSNNQPFYVGKGKGDRAYKTCGRNQKWLRTANKYGYVVEIVFDNLSEDEAFQCEKDTILEFKYFGYDLCNMTNGGEGRSGSIVSKETRLKLAAVHLNKPKKPEAIEKTAAFHRGRKRTAEQNLRNAEAQKGNRNREDKSEYVFYSEDDIFIGTRRDIEKYANLRRLSINFLFKKEEYRYSNIKNWSVLTFNQMLLLSNLLKE